jgi:small subunit ribosomal protein S7
MPRRSVSTQRRDVRDARYRDPLAGQFINSMLLRGKKSLAARTFYQALDYLDGKGEGEPIEMFRKAMNNVKPMLEVKSRRVGGSTYQVPVEVREERQLALAIRWLLQFARARRGRSMAERLGAELLDAYNNTGSAAKKKEDTHRMAEANRAFAHYRW